MQSIYNVYSEILHMKYGFSLIQVLLHSDITMGTPKGKERKPFILEVDDRTDEERAQSKEQEAKDHWASALRLGPTEKDRSPMDSEYQEDVGETTPQIKINRNFLK